MLCLFNIFLSFTLPMQFLFLPDMAKSDQVKLLDEVFLISRIIKAAVRVISLSLWLQLITLTRDLDYSGYHKNRK